MPTLADEVARRRSFAIISHPDAGKTTITEKLLQFGGAIQLAGTVKGRKAARHATSDWMKLEQQRGISVTTSVMQFEYHDRMVNLLDTPGHEDFSEDTYRTLTAVDAALMVIDVAKGVEARTIKLMEVCRMRDTPIHTFINKLDREGRDAVDLLDEVEDVLKMRCAPVTWPIGMGQGLKGVYHLLENRVYLYTPSRDGKLPRKETIDGLGPEAEAKLGSHVIEQLREEVELIQGVYDPLDLEEYLAGRQTPVFFGTALTNFGVRELLDHFVENAPGPQDRETDVRPVSSTEPKLTGFVFKVQANMDPQHRDRIAFMRICSGKFERGMKMHHVRLNRDIKVPDAVTFMAASRDQVETAWSGDIIGLHNHGTIGIGDTFTEGEKIRFAGIPNFAPELFRRVVLRDPLKAKALQKGLRQLSEEGATQFFKPQTRNDLILGAIGVLQFDVVAQRLADEYGVKCSYDNINVATVRWVECDDDKMLREFKSKASENLALDHGDALVYLAPTRVNLQLTEERWPDIRFRSTREHSVSAEG